MATFSIDSKTASFLIRLAGFLSREGIQSYLVGGSVRDGLLGRAKGDVDLAVVGEALAVARKVGEAFAGKFVLLDEANKVARVVLPEEGWHLDFSQVRGDIEQDLGYRDFTIDAMAIALEQVSGPRSEVQLIDPLGGSQDLERRLIRAVSASARRSSSPER